MILKTRYLLPPQQQSVSPPSETQPCPSPLPYVEPESLVNDLIETDSLEALADDQEEERWKIPLVARPDDTAENHQE